MRYRDHRFRRVVPKEVTCVQNADLFTDYYRAGLRRGCLRPAPPEPEAPSVTVWDSAGIEIVENHAPEWGDSARWTMDPEPAFVIGGSAVVESPDDPSHLIWGIQGVARLSNGNILVHSGGEEAVFLFEPSGELVTRIGRKGQGPGEFIRPQHIQALPGDTLGVWDYMFTGVSYFDATGNFLRKRPIDVATVLARTRSARENSPESVMIPLADGSFIVQRGLRDYPRSQPGTILRRPVEYLRIDTAYALHSFGWWRYFERLWTTHQLSYPWPPFPVHPRVAAGGRPLSVYVADGAGTRFTSSRRMVASGGSSGGTPSPFPSLRRSSTNGSAPRLTVTPTLAGRNGSARWPRHRRASSIRQSSGSSWTPRATCGSGSRASWDPAFSAPVDDGWAGWRVFRPVYAGSMAE